MIQVSLVLTGENPPRLFSISARGHAPGAERGYNILCASFTALIRSFAALMETSELEDLHLKAENSGEFDFECPGVPPETGEWFRGVSDMLMRGIADLKRDYPDEIDIRLERR